MVSYKRTVIGTPKAARVFDIYEWFLVNSA